MEIEVTNDSIINGILHNYYKNDRYEHIKLQGKINWEKLIVAIDEESEISHNVPKIYKSCFGVMELQLQKRNNHLYLSGYWEDKNKKLFHCPRLKTTFERTFYDSLDSQEALPKRKTDIQTVIELGIEEIDSIVCSIYDNGEIDNDSVSVFLNDSLVISKQKLTEKLITFVFEYKMGQTNRIKLFANNLGSIPPNTALMIITTRKKQYTLSLLSDYSQNGTVELFLRE